MGARRSYRGMNKDNLDCLRSIRIPVLLENDEVLGVGGSDLR